MRFTVLWLPVNLIRSLSAVQVHWHGFSESNFNFKSLSCQYQNSPESESLSCQ